MFRFFVNKKVNNTFILDAETLKHIKVARIEKEHFICIYEGKFYVTNLKDNVAQIVSEIAANHEFLDPVILGVSLIKIKRFEWLIQKAAELGATHLIPLVTDKTQIDLKKLHNKYQRWELISKNACQQAFRNQIMEILPIKKFSEVLKSKVTHKYIAHEKTTTIFSEKCPSTFRANSLFLVGPEGGFSESEIELAHNQNFKIIYFGPRILRSETSALYLLSRLNDHV